MFIASSIRLLILHGRAGRKAFKILSSNALRVFAINSVGDFVLLLGKAFVVAITVLIGICVIQKMDGVHHTWVILVLIGLFAYLVSHCFISVYEMTIDTIFICFCAYCPYCHAGLWNLFKIQNGLLTNMLPARTKHGRQAQQLHERLRPFRVERINGVFCARNTGNGYTFGRPLEFSK